MSVIALARCCSSKRGVYFANAIHVSKTFESGNFYSSPADTVLVSPPTVRHWLLSAVIENTNSQIVFFFFVKIPDRAVP